MFASRPWKLAWQPQVAWTPARRTTLFTYEYLFDGTWITHNDRASRQVVRGPLCGNTTPAALSFLHDDRSLVETFAPKLLSVASNAVELELAPLETWVGINRLVLTIDPDTYQVRRAMVIDHAGDTSSLELPSVRLANRKSSRRTFSSRRMFESDLTRAAKAGLSVVQHTSCTASSSGTAAATTTGAGVTE